MSLRTSDRCHWCGNPQNTPRAIDKRTGAGAPRLPCVKGAVMAVSRKAMTEGLSEWASSDPLSPSVRTGAAPLGQQEEPLRSAISSRKYRGIATPACALARDLSRIFFTICNFLLQIHCELWVCKEGIDLLSSITATFYEEIMNRGKLCYVNCEE